MDGAFRAPALPSMVPSLRRVSRPTLLELHVEGKILPGTENERSLRHDVARSKAAAVIRATPCSQTRLLFDPTPGSDQSPSIC